MLLGRIFRRSHFDTGIKLFSGNTSLLETFSQVTGGASSREANTAASDPESKGRLQSYSKSLLTAEPAAEFNDTRGFQSFDEPHRFRAGETYKPMDLSSSRYNTFSQEQHQQDIELRPSVDIFKRQKCSALFTHKNTHLLSTMLTQTGKILHRKATGHSAKTQRHLSKAIRRARQMGILPYMHRPKVF